MLTLSNVIFYIAFLGQIFVLSYYYPGKILARLNIVREAYPPEEYPKLYPKSKTHFIVSCRRFRLASRIIMAIGFVVLFMIMFVIDQSTFADDGYVSEAFPAVFGMLQFLPLMALEISEFSQFKQMRQAQVTTTRTADMRRRGLFDLISRRLFFVAVALFVSAVAYDFYVQDLVADINTGSVARVLVMTVTNLFLVAIAIWLMYGKKLNPHQAADDRVKHIGASVRSFHYSSMALSVFWIVQITDDIYDLAFLDATILSVYFQAIAFLSIGTLLRTMKLKDINFEVYRDNPASA